MQIQRVIVQDNQNRHVLANRLNPVCSEQQVREQFARARLPILSLSVDTVGVASIVLANRLPR